MSGSGISWAICKSAPRCRQITTPAPHHSVFLQAGCPSCRPTNSVKALKGYNTPQYVQLNDEDFSPTRWRQKSTGTKLRHCHLVYIVHFSFYAATLAATVYRQGSTESTRNFATATPYVGGNLVNNCNCRNKLLSDNPQ